MAGGRRFGLAPAETPADVTTHPDRASSTVSGRPGPAGARRYGLIENDCSYAVQQDSVFGP